MSPRKELEKRLEKKLQEISVLDKSLGEAMAYAQALQDALKLLPSDPPAPDTMKPGSEMARARDAIRDKGRPLHINEILDALGKIATPQNRASLAGSISGYVRRGKIFTRPCPNTFGLVESERGPDYNPNLTSGLEFFESDDDPQQVAAASLSEVFRESAV